MNASPKILMMHQGAELYGSDRSFASSVQAVRARFPDAQIDVILPFDGPLTELIRPFVSRLIFESKGILRKIEIKRAPFRAISHLASAAFRYRKFFMNYDICYINTIVCVSAIFALRNKGTKNFVHVREIPSRFQSKIFNALLKYSSAEIIYNSNATATAFGIPGAVIYNGVGKPALDFPQKHEKHATVRLLIVGRINPWKGQQFVLNALKRYGSDINAHIRIVGDVFPGYEHLLDELRQTASKCTQQVDFVGFSKNTADEIAWADFVLVPSILPEPFGRVAVESFAVERPVIASDGGGLCEIITEQIDGFLFDPSSEENFVSVLRQAIALTPDKYKNMCLNAALKYQQKFTESHYKKCVAQIISDAHQDERTPAQP